jgi:Protein of unknown function (DUF3494).
MNHHQKHLSACLIALAALFSTAPMAWAATAPSLNSASGYAVLSAGSLTPTTPPTAPAVTTTGSTTVITIKGNVGSAGPVTLTNSAINGNVDHTGFLTVTPPSTISGTSNLPLPPSVVTDFNNAYNSYPSIPCDNPSLGGFQLAAAYVGGTLTLTPGVYCSSGSVAFSGTTLFLDALGDPNAVWIFKIGTDPTQAGALAGTDFSVVFLNNVGQPCNVTWWVANAATVTRGSFLGTILAGAADPLTGKAITMTGVAGAPSSFNGNALAGAAVTVTDFNVTSCGATQNPPPPPPSCDKDHDGKGKDGKGKDGDCKDKDGDGHDKDKDNGHDKDKDHKDDSHHSFKDGGNPFGHDDGKKDEHGDKK